MEDDVVRQKWEYCVLAGDAGVYDTVDEDELAELGKKGWEAVSAGWAHDNGNAYLTSVLLKRPLEEQ